MRGKMVGYLKSNDPIIRDTPICFLPPAFFVGDNE